jgi:hypothetical protein
MLTFHHLRDGKPAIVARVTNRALGFNYGPDRDRQLVVSLESGDLIVFRPKGTRQRLALSVFDAYAFALRCAAMAASREKRTARAAKRRECVR